MNKKTVIISFAAGFIFSFIIGIAGGNPFLVIFARAVLTGICFAVIFFTAGFFISKMSDTGTSTKEFEINHDNPQQKKDPGKVDIILDDDIDPENIYEDPEELKAKKVNRSDENLIEEIEENVIDEGQISDNDDLGDIVEVMGEYTANGTASEGEDFVGSTKTYIPKNDKVDEFGSMDSASLAQAVQTMIRKEGDPDF